MFRPLWAVLVTAGAGAVAWVVTAAAGGRREAWDSELYLAVLPVIATIVAGVAYVEPHRVWRWAMFPFAAQALVAFLQNPTGSLLPLGLVVFFVLGALCLVPAWVAAAAARRSRR